MKYPSSILKKAIENICNLPGIGQKTSLRLVLHILDRMPKNKIEELSESIRDLADKIKYCKICNIISDDEVCDICSCISRDHTIICIVEDIRDVMAIESTQHYTGLYHVLGGKISPIDGIGPDNINIKSLKNRINDQSKIKEIIFALSSTIEGDTTVFYIYKTLKHFNIKFSIISRGIGVGEEIEYSNEATISKSIENRIPYIK